MKTQVTVVPTDNYIIVDGIALTFKYSSPTTMHALQWANCSGHIELNTGERPIPLTPENYAEHVQPFVRMWEKVKARTEEEANKPPTLDEMKAGAIQAIKDVSYAAEIVGITLQGISIPTDRNSQSMITGAVVGAMLDDTKITHWQTSAVHADGTPVFVHMPAQMLKSVALAVREHVQACFDLRDAKFVEVAALKSVEAVKKWMEEELHKGFVNGG